MVTVFNKPISNETHIMTGATSENPGTAGLAPAPAIGDQTKVLTGAGVWGLPGVVTINGRAPNPVTGDIVVIEGGGSSSYGSYRLDATITPSDWVASNGVYVAVVTNQYITSGMDGSETWLDNEYAQLGDAEFVSDTGTLTITTTIQPTENWNLHASLAVNGADVLADVSAIRTNITEIETNLGSPSSASGVTGADAFSKINTLNGNLADAVYNADCNNMTKANICYYADGNTANKPTGISSWLLIRVIGKAGGFITQIASEENVLNGHIWYRTKTSTEWGSWQELALNSNINNLITTEGKTQAITWASTSNVYYEGYTDIAKTGYTPIGIIGHEVTGPLASAVVVSAIEVGSNNRAWISARMISFTPSDTTGNGIVFTVLYKKT